MLIFLLNRCQLPFWFLDTFLFVFQMLNKRRYSFFIAEKIFKTTTKHLESGIPNKDFWWEQENSNQPCPPYRNQRTNLHESYADFNIYNADETVCLCLCQTKHYFSRGRLDMEISCLKRRLTILAASNMTGFDNKNCSLLENLKLKMFQKC